MLSSEDTAIPDNIHMTGASTSIKRTMTPCANKRSFTYLFVTLAERFSQLIPTRRNLSSNSRKKCFNKDSNDIYCHRYTRKLLTYLGPSVCSVGKK